VSQHKNRSKGAALIIVLCATLLAACSHSPSVQFYSLSPTPTSTGDAPLDLALAIGPAQFPRSLARSQIVTRGSGSRVNVDEYHVWSAPLEYEFLRVLGDDIGSDIQSDRIAVYPREPAFNIDYRISLDVLQFDGVPGDSVTLRVRWAIAPPGGDAVAVNTFEITQPTGASEDKEGYDALVLAHSAAIGALAKSITEKLRTLDR
jgi:uncharacterized lipoprotein YmbA